MPIEDIDFLLKNSEEEHIVMLVDSRDRDMRLYPYSNSFEVVFPEPFQNVTGVEVLNTSIPRTMFMLDSHNEVLVIRTGVWRNPESANEAVAGAFNHQAAEMIVRLQHQDFQNSDNFFNNINEQLLETVAQLDNKELAFFDVDSTYERKKADFPIPRFASAYTPFAIDVHQSTCASLFGLPRVGISQEDRRKYMTTSTVFNNRGRAATNVTPYNALENDISVRGMDGVVESSSEDRSPRTCEYGTTEYVNINTPVDSDIERIVQFTCSYTHRPSHKVGGFLTEIEVDFISTHLATYRTAFPTITLSMRSTAPNGPSFVHECEQTDDPKRWRFRVPIRKRWLLECISIASETVYDIDVLVRVPASTVPFGVLNDVRMRVKVGYGHFVYTRVSNAPQLLVSIPIVDEKESEDTYARTISDASVEYQITDVSSQDAFAVRNASERYVGVLPTRSTDTPLICTEITVRIPHDPRTSSPLNFPPPDTALPVYWMDLYQGDKGASFARVFLEVRFENDAMTLTYRNDDIRAQVLNSVVYNRLQFMASDEYHDYTCRFQLFRLVTSSTSTFVRLHNATFEVRWVPVQAYGVQSPGMINLATERYLVLRCDEIEEHVRGSRSVRELSPGLGLINIDVQGYAVDNQEFFSVKYRKFHPIGSVSRLMFRFERGSDKQLYDFKNVDLHFVLAVRYLRPLVDRNFTNYTLNPDYDPNYMGYIRHSLQANERDSTDDEELNGPNYIQTYRRMELMDGRYSSSSSSCDEA